MRGSRSNRISLPPQEARNHARSGSFQLSPDRVDDAIKAFASDQLPRYREQSGYKGFSLLVNRQSGKLLGVSFWKSEDDLEASDELGAEAREGLQHAGGGSGDIVREDWEVAVDDEV